jgi:hypothetical protein
VHGAAEVPPRSIPIHVHLMHIMQGMPKRKEKKRTRKKGKEKKLKYMYY